MDYMEPDEQDSELVSYVDVVKFELKKIQVYLPEGRHIRAHMVDTYRNQILF